MLDLKYIRDNLEAVRENTRRRQSLGERTPPRPKLCSSRSKSPGAEASASAVSGYTHTAWRIAGL